MISLKTYKDIEILREGGKILAGIMKELETEVRAGITTKYLDEMAEKLISYSGAKPAFLGHHGFPSILCTSINEEIVHGVPTKRILKKGDIISLDLGLCYKDLYTDMAVTLAVGEVSRELKKLVETAKRALDIGIAAVKPKAKLGDIGYVIQKYVESQGFIIFKELSGHGVGYAVHEDPLIPNYGKSGTGEVLESGMTLAIEPIIGIGIDKIKVAKNGFTYVSFDSKPSAHFEHSVLVTEQGVEVLTKL